MRRRVVVFTLTLALALGAGASVLVANAGGRSLDAFSGLGAWVDVFDYVPAFADAPGPRPVTPATVDDLAALGTRTIYLQASIDDARVPGLIVHRKLVGQMLQRAHDNGVAVVAWYYPQLVDPARDRHRLEALIDFRYKGEQFDAIAFDIESRQVPDVAERNTRLVRLARQVRDAAGDDLAIGAIVYPAVQMEVVNPNLWPDFPYKELARHLDVWMPMAYWTYRSEPYRDAFLYTEESVRRLRANLEDEDAAVHPIGGLSALSTPADLAALVRAAKEVDALGWSMYDASTTATTAWAVLRDSG